MRGVETQTPEMPGFYEPNYERWKEMLERFAPDEDTMLVGHSCGGGFLVRWLCENNVKVGKVVLVAPWLGFDVPHFDLEFFNFDIDPEISLKTAGLTVMYYDDDMPSILKSVEILKSKLVSAEFQEFKDKGHFLLKSLKTDHFPELLALLAE